jgi:PAS domain S-box-containing protein
MGSTLSRLEALGVQQAQFAALKEKTAAKLDELKRTVALMKAGARGAALQIVHSDEGKTLMDDVRGTITQTRQAQDALLRERALKSQASARIALLVIVLSGSIGVCLVCTVFLLNQRNDRVRERAARAVAEQRERLRTTLASIGDAVISTDVRGCVTDLNSTAESLTGWARQDAIGQPLDRVFRIINEQTRQPVENPATKAIREGVVVGLANHTVLIARDGRECPIDDSAAPIRCAHGEVVGCVLVFRDVAKRRQAEEALRDADRRKDEFLATLAHELRNPLAPIRNSVALLRGAKGNPELIQQASEMMERQVGQMVRLVDDLLDVSRIAAGKLHIRKDRVDLAAVVQSAVETSRPRIETHAHQLTISLPAEPIHLEADPARLTQVVANLLDNAAKYTEKGGSIWLTVQRHADLAIVSVRDTGVGIPEDHLPYIFKAFHQVQPALERSGGGLGIGLSLIRGLVELHEGSIEARSEGPGMGSEFTIRLPISEPAAPALGAPTLNGEQPGPARKRRILVVDDNRDAAESLVMVLRLMGHELYTAYNGLEGVQAAATFVPEVVLLDIGLPKMNGYEAASHIRAQTWGKNMVLIAVTGYGQEDDKKRALEAGCDHHLTKPVDPAALEKLLALIGVKAWSMRAGA